jgi:hypothetical protein
VCKLRKFSVDATERACQLVARRVERRSSATCTVPIGGDENWKGEVRFTHVGSDDSEIEVITEF